jgi:ankyrin repeat protein
MSESKELSVLEAAVQRLIDSDDGTIDAFCHNAADVSVFEDALHQCGTEHFREAAAAAAAAAAATTTPTQTGSSQPAVHCQDDLQKMLWQLLFNLLTRNNLANERNHLSWSVDGYSTVARLAKSILSNWCIDKHWIDYIYTNDDNYKEYTILIQAAQHGHTSVIELLLGDPRVDKTSIDHTDRLGKTALWHASRRGHVSVVELLLADPRVDKTFIDHAPEEECTALMAAALKGHTLVLDLLLADPRVDKSSIDHANAYGETALLFAACNDRISVVERLLADPRVDKTSIDVANTDGLTALLYAAGRGHASVVELLLADPRVDKAFIDHASRSGWTALMHAAAQGHTSVVELLLADPRVDNASFDYTNRFGDTALWYASKHGHVPVVNSMTSDSRSSWNSIVETTQRLRSMAIEPNDTVVSVLLTELTRRQMYVIFPSRNRQFWPTPAADLVLSDAKCDAQSSGDGPVAAREQSDGNVRSETPETDSECALITSFFKSPLLDVNVLCVIREYVTYTM